MYLVTNALSERLGSLYPFWQAPLPFDLINAEMSGRISAQGAHGIIRIAAHDTRDSLELKTAAYRRHYVAPSYCFAHCLPQQPQGNKPDTFAAEILQNHYNSEPLILQRGDHFLDLLDTAIAAEPRAIGFAQGLPDRETLALIRERGILTFAIVGNLLEALSADDFGIDVLVLQGMEAGGERSAFTNDLPRVEQSAQSLLQQVRAYSKKPLVLWGDISSAADVVAAIISGAQAVMLDRPFLACSENDDLSPEQRERVINGSEYQSSISDLYTARPLRCLYQPFSDNDEEVRQLLRGQEDLFAATFAQRPEERPLPIAISAIEDPRNLTHFLNQQAQHIRQLIA